MTFALEPGTLWGRLTARARRALRCGALQPIATESVFVEGDGLRFLVRVLINLDRKQEAGEAQGESFDPFLPYDPELFVAAVSPTHVALLNKFNVLDHHLLVVTRRFEEQETLLNLSDFAALWTCLAEIRGLAFYNAGPVAGASQRHKHLQLVPLPLCPDGPPVPVQAALAAAHFRDDIGTVPAFRFAHAFARLDERCSPGRLLSCYHALRSVFDLEERMPYNLLATREWMLFVPRVRECFASISINALGFAGALLVRDRKQLALVEKLGPMEILRRVSAPL